MYIYLSTLTIYILVYTSTGNAAYKEHTFYYSTNTFASPHPVIRFFIWEPKISWQCLLSSIVACRRGVKLQYLNTFNLWRIIRLRNEHILLLPPPPPPPNTWRLTVSFFSEVFPVFGIISCCWTVYKINFSSSISSKTFLAQRWKPMAQSRHLDRNKNIYRKSVDQYL
jgi:hypothetical protein